MLVAIGRLVDQGKSCFNPIRNVYMVNVVKHGVMLKEAEEMIFSNGNVSRIFHM